MTQTISVMEDDMPKHQQGTPQHPQAKPGEPRPPKSSPSPDPLLPKRGGFVSRDDERGVPYHGDWTNPLGDGKGGCF